MEVTDLRYVAVLETDGATLVFDSIECLILYEREHRSPANATIWLADHGSNGELHPETEMTVVRADYPSPMGKGFAAFADPGLADEEAARRGGIAKPLSHFVGGPGRREGS